MRSTIKLLLLNLVLVSFLSACNEKKSKPTVEKPEIAKITVYTVNYPLKYFTERIGGAFVDVQFPAPKDVDPAYWSPTAEIINSYQKADIILLNGADYAKWIPKVSLPTSKMVNTSKNSEDEFIKVEGQATHTHGPEGAHTHDDIAFTTWLDPTLAIAQAEVILQTLIAKTPTEKAFFEQQFLELKKDLLSIDSEIAEIISNKPEMFVVFSHPVYQYFQKRYKIKGTSVHWEPNELPTAAMWHDFEHQEEHQKESALIWEGEPLKETVEKLQKTGIKSTVFSPCGNVPEKGDYMMVMQANLENLQQVFGK